MLNESHVTLRVILKEMIGYCQKIREILKDDSEQFSKDKFAIIEENNKKKMEFLERLSALINKFKASYPNGLKEVIKNKEAKTPEQNEIYALIEQLHTEISQCYQHIEVNSSLVFTNLKMLKDIWEKLIVKSESNVYDESGTIVRT